MQWRGASGRPESHFTLRKLLSNYSAPAFPRMLLWSGILAMAVFDWVFLPLLKWTVIILVILVLFVSRRQLGAGRIVVRSIRLGGAGVYRVCVSPALRVVLALFAMEFIVLLYSGTVLSAINLGWLLLTTSMSSLFGALDTRSLPDGQRYLFISIVALGCLVVWRVLAQPKAHGHLLRLSQGSRQFGLSVTFAKTSWRTSPVKEIRRGTEFRPTRVQTPTPMLTSSEMRIGIELGPGANVERVERLALHALSTLDWGTAVVHTPFARQRLADGRTCLQIRFYVADVARGKLHVLSDARASLWDCLHAGGVAFALRTSS